MAIPIKQVRCGGHHNLVLLQNGAIFAWGFNNHYQCGFYENIKNKLPSISITPFYIPKNIIPSEITDIQCSFLSSAIITNNGVYIIGDLTAKANAFAKSNEDLRFLTLPFSKFNFLLNAASGGADHFVLFTHNENSEGSQGYFSKNLSELLHIESSIIPSVTSRSNGSNDSSSFKYSTDFSTR
ncbi:hypothetical protein C9374_002121 [Naegleria lovaniensis]|uniref:Uncharacterized protein n=1 Tax=Naegleria lovaniensis TaxID=51637 RepID=A0AA88KN18_NAELO|nr:uncharacterized protein C9374_002121 [Naegleria lovaniensis]KAG2387086.1 hypothetical protein C9374_002121 [Naegleria lovaniensis]